MMLHQNKHVKLCLSQIVLTKHNLYLVGLHTVSLYFVPITTVNCHFVQVFILYSTIFNVNVQLQLWENPFYTFNWKWNEEYSTIEYVNYGGFKRFLSPLV